MIQTVEEVRRNLLDYSTISAYNSVQAFRALISPEDEESIARLKTELISINNFWGQESQEYAKYIYNLDRYETLGSEKDLSNISSSTDDRFYPALNSTLKILRNISVEDIKTLRELEQQLVYISQDVVNQRFRKLIENSTIEDRQASHVQLYVSKTACAWCCMIASSSASKRMRSKFSTSAPRAGETYQAKLHDNCHCVFRPVFNGFDAPVDPVSKERIVEFIKAYDDIMESGDYKTSDVRGSEGFLSAIRAKGF